MINRSSWALLACSVGWASAHPLCFTNDRPTDESKTKLKWCPEDQYDGNPFLQYGACCTDIEEAEVEAKFDEAGALTEKCASLYKQVMCGKCHSFSAHLFEKNGAELGPWDGMMMTLEFCDEFTKECAGQIDFPTYDGESYCDKHTGGGATSQFWSYPYSEPEIFTGGLTDVFPSTKSFPKETLSVKLTPDGSHYWAAGQGGEVKKIKVSDNSISKVVDIEGGDFYEEFEEGLLDLAFDPEFDSNNFFYLSFTVNLGTDNNPKGQQNRLSKFTYVDGNPTATKNSEEILITSGEKFNSVHSAGWCDFKPSAYGKGNAYNDLYWTTGDGGPQTDPYDSSQTLDNLLGAMIRISVPSAKGSTGYKNPGGNYPGGPPELCAIGLRNPYRCGFDRANDDLYCGDVGHTDVEEISVVECGKNYGWSRFEGNLCQKAVEDNDFNPPCKNVDRSGFEWPIYEYCHPDYDSEPTSQDAYTGGVDICGDREIEGHCVIGGFVYRGSYYADLLEGAYIFGDNVNQNIYYLKKNAAGTWKSGTILSDNSAQVIQFIEDKDGEIMFLTRKGDIFHLPCGDMCASTCLDQGEDQPSLEPVGCYKDTKAVRALTLKTAPICSGGEAYMSPEVCASYCSTIDGAIYAGVENRIECYCGKANDDYDVNGKYPADKCSTLCESNPDQTCGGPGAIDIFKLGSPGVGSPSPSTPGTVPPDTPTPIPDGFLGCYLDSKTDRALDSKVAIADDMTAAVCKDVCEGSKYYGTQFSNECWCSDSDDYAKNGEGVCNMVCAGASDGEICGGKDLISVYGYDTAPTPVTTPAPGTTPAPAAPATPTPTPEGFIGCYKDDKEDRVLDTKAATGKDMTAAVCKETCEGSTFYGTMFSNECWCGDSTDYDKHGEGVCDMACAGDSDEMCGGKDLISIYGYGTAPTPVITVAPLGTTTPSPAAPVTPTPTPDGFIGCYKDSKDDRALDSKVATQKDMTAAVCKEICEGSKYYGTQFGNECWCSDSDDYAKNGEGVCDMACAGDSDEMCGGHDLISVYGSGTAPTPVTSVAPFGTTTPSPVSPVTPTPTPDGFIGCFKDVKDDRALDNKAATSDDMTAAACKEICSDFTYYGTQNANECWCSSSSGYDRHGEADCDMVCSGDGSDGEVCGGYDMVSVYGNVVVDPPAPTTTDTTPAPVDATTAPEGYMGCYADKKEDRVLDIKIASEKKMNASICKGLCSEYSYYGTQFSKECWCGADGSPKHGDGVCDMLCAGASEGGEMCGGHDNVSVYSNGSG